MLPLSSSVSEESGESSIGINPLMKMDSSAQPPHVVSEPPSCCLGGSPCTGLRAAAVVAVAHCSMSTADNTHSVTNANARDHSGTRAHHSAQEVRLCNTHLLG